MFSFTFIPEDACHLLCHVHHVIDDTCVNVSLVLVLLQMRQVLKVEPRDVRDTIIEMAHSLIQGGFVKTTPGYRGPGGPEERQLYMAVKL